jgi:hypothetical protein
VFVLDRARKKKTVHKLQSKQIAEIIDNNGKHSIIRDHQNKHWMTVPSASGVDLYPMEQI